MAEKNIVMQRKKSDGTYDQYYPKTLAINVGVKDTSGNFIATDVEGVLSELFTSVSNGKTLIATAVTDKGIPASGSDTFLQLSTKIKEITTKNKLFIRKEEPASPKEGDTWIRFTEINSLLCIEEVLIADESLEWQSYYLPENIYKYLWRNNSDHGGDWEEGFNNTSHITLGKTSNYLYFNVMNRQDGGNAAYVTRNPIDLTSINYILADLYSTGFTEGDDSSPSLYLIAGKNKNGGWLDGDARISLYFDANEVGTGTAFLNVSNLNGLYYVRIHAQIGTAATRSGTGQLRINSVVMGCC